MAERCKTVCVCLLMWLHTSTRPISVIRSSIGAVHSRVLRKITSMLFRYEARSQWLVSRVVLRLLWIFLKSFLKPRDDPILIISSTGGKKGTTIKGLLAYPVTRQQNASFFDHLYFKQNSFAFCLPFRTSACYQGSLCRGCSSQTPSAWFCNLCVSMKLHPEAVSFFNV